MDSLLKKFIIKESYVDDIPIISETKIQEDLGIYGDDAIDFILSYSKKFNVDVSNFMAADYFEPEGDIILPAILRMFTGKIKPIRKILTVGHLEKGIILGKLDKIAINN